MKMLAPGIGWVLAAGGRLLWTENGGADWKNITPHFAGSENIGKIFFLDRSRGWVANSLYEPDSDELQLTLASTTEGGANWSQVASTLRLKDYGISPGDAAGGGVGALAFTDALHGWLYMEFGGQTMNTRWSFFLVTSDGGRTWKRARNAPAVENASILLAPPTDGWLLGSDHEDPYEQLYVTRDQARSWKHVSVRAPKEVLSATETNYELPTFLNKSHGYLPVNYSYYDGTNDTESQVLFATDDGDEPGSRIEL